MSSNIAGVILSSCSSGFVGVGGGVEGEGGGQESRRFGPGVFKFVVWGVRDSFVLARVVSGLRESARMGIQRASG